MTAPAILLLGNDPTEQHPLLAWNLRTNVRHHNARIYIVNHAGIKLERQAHESLIIPQDGYANAVRFLGGEDAAFPGTQLGDEAKKFREALRAEPSLLIIFGSEYRGRDIDALVNFGMGLPHARFACLGDYVNSRGAADMGLLPGLLPGYVPVAQGGAFAEEYGEALPQAPGLDLVEMFDAAERGELAALYVVGANPVARYGIDPAALKNTFIVVQDMFLTETALLADVVLPTSNLYEKAGTVTNTYGDQQLVKKAADRAGVRSDFELMVRLADCMGADPEEAGSLRPRSPRGYGTDPGRAVWRSGSSQRVAGGAKPGTQAQPLRPLRHSRRDPAPGARATRCRAWNCWLATMFMCNHRWCKSTPGLSATR